MKIELTGTNVRSHFDYDELSGVLTWKSGRMAGKDVAGKDTKGYLRVNFSRTSYKAHRVVWLWMKGCWPTHVIDHKDGVKDNNRWDNLRDVTQAVNVRNVKGLQGVCFNKRAGKYEAVLEREGKRHWLGRHTDWFEAVCARKSFEISC